MTIRDDLQALDAAGRAGRIETLLATLVEQLRCAERFHDLFEALKMQLRARLGLPLLYGGSGEELPAETRRQLDDGLVAACRDVGSGLLKKGALRDGWLYLRPVGDPSTVRELAAALAPGDDNIDEFIEVLFHEGVDPPRGYQLLLDHYGTCNAITTFDTTMSRHTRTNQQACAGLLVRHLHAELLRAVRRDIVQQEGAEPPEQTLAQLVTDRDWLFGPHSYHLDTTHLASVVRIARIADDEPTLRLALDLTAYGKRLASQYQYAGDEPFLDIYPSHELFFAVQLGERAEEAADYFRDKAASLPVSQFGSQPVEIYLQVLDRLERFDTALDVLMTFAREQQASMNQILPVGLELCRAGGDYEPLLAFCRDREDRLALATTLAHRATAAAESGT